MGELPEDISAKFEKAIADAQNEKRVLRLYVAGNTARSAQTIANIREVCETRLKNRYSLEVIDIYQQPDLVRDQQIIAAPTLIKLLPPPLRRMIGDLSRKDRILIGLDLNPVDDKSNGHKDEMEGE